MLSLFDTIGLDDGWRVFYPGVVPATFAQALVGMLVIPQLEHCVDEWMPLRERLCMLMLKLFRLFLVLHIGIHAELSTDHHLVVLTDVMKNQCGLRKVANMQV